MEKINFIGAFNKIDLIMYISKILVELDKKVLIVDATINQRAKYIVPTLEIDKEKYITNFSKIDIAVGFKNYDEIKEFLGVPISSILTYDYVFIDIDDIFLIDGFKVNESDRNYFVTSMDAYSLKKGLEVLKELKTNTDVGKIYFSNHMSKSEDEYLNFLSLGYRIKWNDEIIYFPYETSDKDIIMNNHRSARIKFKGLSNDYKNALMYIAQEISKDANCVKKIYKQIERGM